MVKQLCLLAFILYQLLLIFNDASPFFIGFGPKLWLWPTGDPAEAADGVQRVWSASWSGPQHRSGPQHTVKRIARSPQYITMLFLKAAIGNIRLLTWWSLKCFYFQVKLCNKVQRIWAFLIHWASNKCSVIHVSNSNTLVKGWTMRTVSD